MEHASSTRRFGSAYNILSYPRVPPPLSPPRGPSMTERRYIHHRLGRLARQAALLSSPSSRFGPVLVIVSPNMVATTRKLNRGTEHQVGVDSWSLTFHTLLEGILRDAEDMAVTIPSKKIRWHFGRLRHHLDKVTLPRLVLLNATTEILFGQRDAHRPDRTSEGETKGNHYCSSQPKVPIAVAVCDWSNRIYGDPLMATVVGEGASRDFLRGFSGRPSADQYCKEDSRNYELLSTYGGHG